MKGGCGVVYVTIQVIPKCHFVHLEHNFIINLAFVFNYMKKMFDYSETSCLRHIVV